MGISDLKFQILRFDSAHHGRFDSAHHGRFDSAHHGRFDSATAGGSTALTTGGSTALTAGGSTALTAGGSTALTAPRPRSVEFDADLSLELYAESLDDPDAVGFSQGVGRSAALSRVCASDLFTSGEKNTSDRSRVRGKEARETMKVRPQAVVESILGNFGAAEVRGSGGEGDRIMRLSGWNRGFCLRPILGNLIIAEIGIRLRFGLWATCRPRLKT